MSASTDGISTELKLHLNATHMPAILDLEGTLPYDIELQVRRGTTDLTRSMNILTDESIFDIPYAFATGLLKLIDLESNDRVDLAFLASSPKPTPKPAIITIRPRENPRLRLFQYDLVIPLQLRNHLSPALVLGRKYRVELAVVDLGVKWWNYGDDADPALPPEPINLVAMMSTHRDFSVVKPLPKPPSISISMALSSNVLHRSKSPPTTVRVAITNQGDYAITVRSSGDQAFFDRLVGVEYAPNIHRITSIKPSPTISNFSINKTSTGEEFVAEPKSTCSLTVGSGGISRRGLTTLAPNVPLTHEFLLMEGADAIVKSMSDDDEFRLRLRPLGVWWSAGTLDDIFGDRKTIRTLPGPCLPLILQSDDELLFRLED